MHCEHCGKPIPDNTGLCEDCMQSFIKAENYSENSADYRKPALNTHLGLGGVICIILTVMCLGLFLSLLPAMEDSKVDADILTAKSIHNAILSAMMDPEIVNKEEYFKDFEALKHEFDLTQCRTDDNCILSEAADRLGIENFYELRSQLRSSGATGRILVTVSNWTEVQVVLEGTKMRHEPRTEITICNESETR